MQTSFFSFLLPQQFGRGTGRPIARRRIGKAGLENTCYRDTRKGLTAPRYPQ
jgi:hypothetical protein